MNNQEINDLENKFVDWQEEEKKNKIIKSENEKNEIIQQIFVVLYFMTLKYTYDKYKVENLDKYDKLKFFIAHHYKFIFFVCMLSYFTDFNNLSLSNISKLFLK